LAREAPQTFGDFLLISATVRWI